MTRGSELKALIRQKGMAILPGVYDALGARLFENAGFDGAYVTGAGLRGALLGVPDIDLLTQTEMTDAARRIAQAVSFPVLADAEAGFGDALNTRRTIQIYEDAGVAGVHIKTRFAPSNALAFPRSGHRSSRLRRCRRRSKPPSTPARTMTSLSSLVATPRARCTTPVTTGTLTGRRSDSMLTLRRGRMRSSRASQTLRATTRARLCGCAHKAVCRRDFCAARYDLHTHTPDDFRELGCSLMIMPSFSFSSATRAIVDTLEQFKVDQLTPIDRQIPFEKYSEMVEYPGLAALK